ncbi:hypothetical protein [Streptomyces albospinus]|nr:hypothetical protein [Streptomyces albospinus]
MDDLRETGPVAMKDDRPGLDRRNGPGAKDGTEYHGRPGRAGAGAREIPRSPPAARPSGTMYPPWIPRTS